MSLSSIRCAARLKPLLRSCSTTGRNGETGACPVSAEGCFDLLDFTDLENKTGATLVLDANYYLDAQTQEKRLRLREMPARRDAGGGRQLGDR